MKTPGSSGPLASPRARAVLIISILLAGAIAAVVHHARWSGSLIRAAEAGDLEAVRAALAAGVDVDRVRTRTTGWRVGEPKRRVETALFIAAGDGHIEIVRLLLGAGADTEIRCTDGGTALTVAAGNSADRTEILRLLLDAGADPITPTLRGRTALEWAIVYGPYESVVLLHSACGVSAMSTEARGRLLLAASRRQDDLQHVVTKLLSIDAGERDIQRAARNGSADDLLRFLAAGADPNTRDADGWAPLHWAAGVGGDETRTRVLLEAGADPSAATLAGFTPLMSAVQTGDVSRVRILLDAGAEPDTVDKDGRSALHLAAWRAGEDTIRLLLLAGARSDIRDAWGQTPADVAQARRRNVGEDVTAAFLDTGG